MVHSKISVANCRCAALVGKALEAFQGGWAGLHVLSQRLRLHALGQLQPLAELQVSTI